MDTSIRRERWSESFPERKDGVLNVFWRDVEPAEGVYDFSGVDQELETVWQGGNQVNLVLSTEGPGRKSLRLHDFWALHIMEDEEANYAILWRRSPQGQLLKTLGGPHAPDKPMLCYWNPEIAQRVIRFYEEVRKRYEGHPAVSGILFEVQENFPRDYNPYARRAYEEWMRQKGDLDPCWNDFVRESAERLYRWKG